MRRGIGIIVSLILVMVFLTGAVFACNCGCTDKCKSECVSCKGQCDCSPNSPCVQKVEKKVYWGRNCWLVTLNSGRLEAKGAGKGTWKDNVHLIDSGVICFWVIGSGKGPMIVYKQGNCLYFDYRKGTTGECMKKDVVYKGDLKKVEMSGYYEGVSLNVITPAGLLINYWVDERGAFLKSKKQLKNKN